jgi:hypothetical protein
MGNMTSASTPEFVGIREICVIIFLGSACVLGPDLSTPSVSDLRGLPAYGVAYSREIIDPVASLQSPMGSVSIGEGTFAKARLLLEGIPSAIRKPHLSASDDGEIGFSWLKGKDRFEAMLQPDDHLVWVTKIDGVFVSGADVLASVREDRQIFYTALNGFYGRT